jgi:hypothetical protein
MCYWGLARAVMVWAGRGWGLQLVRTSAACLTWFSRETIFAWFLCGSPRLGLDTTSDDVRTTSASSSSLGTARRADCGADARASADGAGKRQPAHLRVPPPLGIPTAVAALRRVRKKDITGSCSNDRGMASNRPDGIVLRHDRDMEGRGWEIWIRRGLFLIPVAIVLVALAGLVGQKPSTSEASSPSARLNVYAPSTLRGGLLWEARFRIDAQIELQDARLVLEPGWLEGMSVNTIEPAPSSETSRHGNLILDLGHIAAGESYVLYLQFQVLPTNVGRRSAEASLWDGDQKLTAVDRTIAVLP